MNKITFVFIFSMALSGFFMNVTYGAVSQTASSSDTEGALMTISMDGAIKFYGTMKANDGQRPSFIPTGYTILDNAKFASMMEKLGQAATNNKHFEDEVWNMTLQEALSHAHQVTIHSVTLGCAASITFLRYLKRAFYFVGEHGGNGVNWLYDCSRRHLKKHFPDADWNPAWDFDNDGGNRAPAAAPQSSASNAIARRQAALIAGLGH